MFAPDFIDIYPNPADDVFFIAPDGDFKNEKTVSIRVKNVFGRDIYRTSAMLEDGVQFAIDCRYWPTGQYSVRVSSGSQWTEKMIMIVR